MSVFYRLLKNVEKRYPFQLLVSSLSTVFYTKPLNTQTTLKKKKKSKNKNKKSAYFKEKKKLKSENQNNQY